MFDATQSTLRISDVLQVLHRQRKKIAWFSGTVLAVTVAVIVFWPRTYESEAKLFVRLGRENVTLDPTATTGQVVSIQSSRELEMQSVIELLESRFVAAGVVEQIGAETILESGAGSGMSNVIGGAVGTAFGLFDFDGEPDENKVKEAAIDSVMGALHATSPNRSAVVNITCQATNPEFAQVLTSTIVDVYRNEHSRLNRTARSDEFFEQQTKLIDNQLQKTAGELRDAKNERGIGSVESHLIFLESQKSEVEQERLRNARLLSEAKARRQALQASLKSLDPEQLTARTEGLPNGAADDMRQQLYTLEIKERELLSLYPETHPLVVAVRRQVENVREIYSGEAGTRSQSTFSANPTYTALDLQASQNAVDIDAFEALNQSLNTQYDAIVSDLKELNDYSVRLKDLELKRELLEQSYRTYAENLEQARIGAELESEQITNVNVAQEAPLVVVPASPNKRLTACLGLLIAVFGGVAVGLFAEQLEQRLRSPAQVEAALGVPVLATIPRATRERAGV